MILSCSLRLFRWSSQGSCYRSVPQSCLTLQPHGPQHVRLLALHQTPGVCSNSCSLSWQCHPTISSSVIPFSSCLQSFPASASFPVSWLCVSGGQSIGTSASASGLPMNTQGWFALGLTGWIFLLSKGLSRVFSSTTFQKHHFFSAQASLWSNSHIREWKKHNFDYTNLCWQSDVSAF